MKKAKNNTVTTPTSGRQPLQGRENLWRLLALAAIAILALAAIGACGSGTAPGGEQKTLAPVALEKDEMLRVVATTNIVGDIVNQVGGDRIELTTLMGVGVDPHSYVPTPVDTAAIHDAHVVFASGAGLEADLDEMLQSAGGNAVTVRLADSLDHLRPLEVQETGHEHEDEDADPHVWLDVQNVIHWVETIDKTLGTLDPANTGVYQANAQAYAQELEALDAWVVEQVATIPEANRKLVTNHPAFGYLAGRYGLEQVGAVYPANPASEPSARDLAALEDAIREYGVPAIFTESTVNPSLAQQVAEDTGVELLALHSGSLGGPGSGAETYILLIRFDVSTIVEALR